MGVDPTVSRREIGTPTQKSLMIIASGPNFMSTYRRVNACLT